MVLQQEHMKPLKSAGAKGPNRIDLYGKNIILMEKLCNLWGPSSYIHLYVPELKALGVVWVVKHFHPYFYGHQ